MERVEPAFRLEMVTSSHFRRLERNARDNTMIGIGGAGITPVFVSTAAVTGSGMQAGGFRPGVTALTITTTLMTDRSMATANYRPAT